MNYCNNCGTKIIDGADVCLNCGRLLNKLEDNKQAGKKGLGISSMILGILGVFLAIIFLGVAYDEISYYDYWGFGDVMGFIILPGILGIVGLCLAITERTNHKNGFNTTGFWLCIATLIIAALIPIMALMSI